MKQFYGTFRENAYDYSVCFQNINFYNGIFVIVKDINIYGRSSMYNQDFRHEFDHTFQ